MKKLFARKASSCLSDVMSDLQSDLEQIKRCQRVPALAAAAHINGEQRGLAVVGKRRIRTKETASTKDKWHIGSCTKPMTATLAGIWIEQGLLDWNTTIGDIFQEWPIKCGWNRVTLEQLLAHHGGAPTQTPANLWHQACKRKGTPAEQRSEFVRGILMQQPDSMPGSRYEYSNSGYAIAGHMLETASKRAWESMMISAIFEPLGMTSAGFGTPVHGLIEQPNGHIRLNRKLYPVEADAGEDSPPAIGPGATVHCSIEDLLKFAASHAGKNCLVSDNTLHRLHRRYRASECSPGWGVVHRNWGEGYVLCHYGANWGWLASMWIAPLKNVAFVAASNAHIGRQACDQAINKMIYRLL